MLQKEDYYQILGVNKDAIDKENKKMHITNQLQSSNQTKPKQIRKKPKKSLNKQTRHTQSQQIQTKDKNTEQNQQNPLDQYGHNSNNAGFNDFHDNFTYSDANDIFQSFLKIWNHLDLVRKTKRDAWA